MGQDQALEPRQKGSQFAKSLAVCLVGLIVQVVIVGLAIQSKAQSGSGIRVDLDVPATVQPGDSFVITHTITNLTTISTTLVAGVSTEHITLTVHTGIPPTGGQPQSRQAPARLSL